MHTERQSWLAKMLPPPNTAGRLEQVRASAGALAALALAALLSVAWMGNAAVWPIAPMGASAVLHADLDDLRTLGARLRNLLRRTRADHPDKPLVVGQIMTEAVQGAYLDTPIVERVPLMANAGLHHIPVLDREERFAGIVTQSDVIAALYQSRLSEPVARRRAG
ncbi:MAG: CBS domain-containing protein [Massilia sp.]|nr:CBS domain-containing protein [Massilia sp.]